MKGWSASGYVVGVVIWTTGYLAYGLVLKHLITLGRAEAALVSALFGVLTIRLLRMRDERHSGKANHGDTPPSLTK